jgi:O-antigen ligase
MNITLGGIPLNELFLVIGLIIAFPILFSTIKQNPIIKPILLWSMIFTISVFLGFLDYGKIALRDASHLIEIWWIPLAIIAFSNVNKEKLYIITKVCLFIYIVRTIIQFLPIEGFFMIEGLHSEMDLFSTSALIVVSNFCFWGIIIKLHKNYLILVLMALNIVISQSRSGIFALFLIGFVYLYVTHFSSPLIKRFSFFLFGLIICYSIISNVDSLSSKTKFGKLLTISEYVDLILSSTGESDTFEGSAYGVILRNNWREDVFKKAENSFSVFLFGQGFGMALTDFWVKENVVVREPHNSYLSVFARTGIIGFLIWIIFHLNLNIKLLSFFRKNKNRILNDYSTKFLLCCYFCLITGYTTALVQPYFEKPSEIIPFFITVGIIIVLLKQLTTNDKLILLSSP